MSINEKRVRPPLSTRSIRLLASLVVAMWLMGMMCTTAARAAESRPPNIVFMLIDDWGQRDLGCYGSTFYETPNCDRLASQGMRFTNGYAACCVCSPTRASLLTGQYPARVGITDYIAGNRQGKLLPADYLKAMPDSQTLVSQPLKAAGYATAWFGKWHVGSAPTLPDKFGFDENFGGFGAGHPKSYFSPYSNPALPDGPKGEDLSDRLTDEAVGFIDRSVKAGKPFLCYLSHYGVHTPLQAKPTVVAKYKAKADKLGVTDDRRFGKESGSKVRLMQDHAVYAAMVETIDDSVGRVMKEIDKTGQTENTVFILTGDNGGLSTSEGWPTSNFPLRAGKGWLYEGGILEPYIVRYPKLVKPGTTCDTPITSPDMYPTWLELAGLPAMPKQHVDGISIVPLLKGGTSLPRETLYWHYPHYGNQGGRPSSAIRDGEFKLIEFYEDGRAELYNLKDDLGEQNDLAAKMPEKVKELRGKLDAWKKSVGAKLPTPNPKYKEGQPPASPKAAGGKGGKKEKEEE